ncbi:hypothetical protein OEZ85_011148 [Tetradesmus obliquus]|uniref:Amino acid transporter transmembrane domain-containing protein n=1 Tax=Tetradesmus obliquus TaxID=3088 RepID=A0ABY8TPE2_TETOB|nr:hypothetical protein OEZ85_011148 [Tetradesmus obliquus]
MRSQMFHHGGLKQGSWFDAPGRRRIVTQYHEVVGYFLGRRAQILAQVLVALGLAGTSIAQIIACAGDMYYINNSFSKRDWELIWGGVLMVFAFVPTFRHFRVLNIIALVGTCYTAILILIITVGHGFSPQHVALMPANAIDFFTGSAVLVSALGNHSIALEMMDAMQKGSQYIPAYFGGWLWSALLVLPHSIAVNYAFPLTIGKNDNVFGVLPVTTAVKASVWLMVIHQWVAFALYCTPLLYMWEKLIGTHTRPWFIRLPSRLPIVLLIYFLAVAFPFYGSINSLIGALSVPATAFVLPALAYNVLYSTQAAREASIYPPHPALQVRDWRPVRLLNWLIVAMFATFGVVAVVFSVIKIAQNITTFSIFAACYQCH